MPPDTLPTEDLAGVEILSVGGPVRGVGSPPEGDFYTSARLQEIAASNQALAAQVKPANKIGHSKEQKLLASSGISDGERPAAGYLDGASFRVSDDGSKLLADVKAVPGKVAQLLKAGAWRTRSVELSKVTEQTPDGTGKVHDWVVTGLAWLGEKLPAVQTLDDVVALYEREEVDLGEPVIVVMYAAGDVIWDPEAGFQDMLSDINAALNPGPAENRYWVQDISLDRTKAIVSDWQNDSSWIVPITIGADGEPAVSPSSDWIAAEQAWVQAADSAAREFSARADTRAMPEITLTAEQQTALAEKLGVEAEGLTPEKLLEAADALKVKAETETPPEQPAPGGPPNPAGDEAARALEARLEKTEQDLAATQESLRIERRRAFTEDVLRSGKEPPGRKAAIETLFDKLGVDEAAKFYEDVKPDEKLIREFGADGDGDGEEAKSQMDEAWQRHYEETFGSLEEAAV